MVTWTMYHLLELTHTQDCAWLSAFNVCFTSTKQTSITTSSAFHHRHHPVQSTVRAGNIAFHWNVKKPRNAQAQLDSSASIDSQKPSKCSRFLDRCDTHNTSVHTIVLTLLLLLAASALSRKIQLGGCDGEERRNENFEPGGRWPKTGVEQ